MTAHWTDHPDLIFEYMVQSDPAMLEARRRAWARVDVMRRGAVTAKSSRGAWRLPRMLRGLGTGSAAAAKRFRRG